MTFADNHCGEVKVLWVSLDVLLDLGAASGKEVLFGAGSVTDWSLFASIEFIKLSVLHNKSNEVFFNLVLDS